MASDKIDLGKLAKAVAERLKEYGQVVDEELERIGDEVAEETVETLKNTGGYEDRTGAYRKSFAVKKEKSGSKITNTVYSKMPDRTHLLERGHSNRDGSRTREFPHMAPAEEKAIESFEQKLAEALKGVTS